MIHLFLDTNILDKDFWKSSASFQALHLLVTNGEIEIHVSQVVKDEHLSHLKDFFVAELDKCAASLNRLFNKSLTEAMQGGYFEALSKLEAAQEIAEQEMNGFFSYWCESNNVSIHEVDGSHGPKVILSYFSGNPPFESIKSKKDFPDAFVFLCAEDLANGLPQNLHAVCYDKNLREALSEVENIVVYESLDLFVRSDNCRELISNISVREQLDLFISELSKARADISAKAWEKLRTHIDGAHIPDDGAPETHLSYVAGYYDPELINLHFEEAIYIGGGIFEIPFDVTLSLVLQFAVFKHDYWELDEDKTRDVSIFEDLNDHYFEVEETADTKIVGVLTLTIDITGIDAGHHLSLDEIGALVKTCTIDNIETEHYERSVES